MIKLDYYVYIYFKLNGTPCYVGKGRGKRWKHHLRCNTNPRLAAEIKKAGGVLPVVMIREGLSDRAAKDFERVFIKAIGRGKSGPLFNFTDGGDGTEGWTQPEHVKAAVSKAQRGRKHSDEARAKMRIAQIGRKHSEETKEKIGRGNRGKTFSEEVRRRMSEGGKGKVLSAQHRANLVGSRRPKSAEHKAKLAAHLRKLAFVKNIDALLQAHPFIGF